MSSSFILFSFPHALHAPSSYRTASVIETATAEQRPAAPVIKSAVPAPSPRFRGRAHNPHFSVSPKKLAEASSIPPKNQPRLVQDCESAPRFALVFKPSLLYRLFRARDVVDLRAGRGRVARSARAQKTHHRSGSGGSARRVDKRIDHHVGRQMETVHPDHRARALR